MKAQLAGLNLALGAVVLLGAGCVSRRVAFSQEVGSGTDQISHQALSGSVVCVRQDKMDRHIVRLDFPWNKETRLTKRAAAYMSPAISPNRKWVVFPANLHDKEGTGLPTATYSLYAVGMDGTALRRVTTSITRCFDPAFLDNNTIVFKGTVKKGTDYFETGLWTVKLDGSGLRKLPGASAASNGRGTPTGKIVFIEGVEREAEIYIMNRDGSGRHQLTHNNYREQTPAVSPNGKQIAFVSRRNGNPDIYLMNVDGSNERRLTTEAGSDYFPAFSSDGTKIIFHSDREDTSQLFVMNRDGSHVSRLTNEPFEYLYPTWR